ncbi:MAG: ion transporter [bacterium]|nr:ion transporter [bacterium]
MKKTVYASLALFALPLFAFAQALQPLRNLVVAVGSVLNLLIPVLIAAALVVFFWGLIKYINKSGGEEGASAGRSTMIAGLVALFIMVSVWGIINLAQNALGVQGNAPVQVPQVPTGR